MPRSAPLRAISCCVLAVLVFGGAGARAESSGSARRQLSFGVDMAEHGLWNEAVFRFEQARALAPGDVRVLNNLAVAYEAVGRFDDALTTYKVALEAAPDHRRIRQNYTRFLEFYQSYKVRKGPAAKPAAEAAPPPPAPSGSGS